ncbi:unnamed protein product [Peronospora destructor]|uniref:RxLR effector protein n=1 Tax=Peronospora destructor TaxID=86335 RepID=A0AAV0URK8_9STRA|nr:unnamed protein product [Peronospora destructor]
MRFNVLVALVVATFVASCSSFVSARTTTRDDYTYDGKETVRHLRENSDVQEERATINIAEEAEKLLEPLHGNSFLTSQKADLPVQANNEILHQATGEGTNENLNGHEIPPPDNPSPGLDTILENKPEGEEITADMTLETPPSSMDWNVFINKFDPEELKLLEKRNINLEELRNGNLKQIYKVMKYAVNGTKKEKGFWTNVIFYLLYTIGFASFMTIVYMLMIGGPKPRTSSGA